MAIRKYQVKISLTSSYADESTGEVFDRGVADQNQVFETTSLAKATGLFYEVVKQAKLEGEKIK